MRALTLALLLLAPAFAQDQAVQEGLALRSLPKGQESNRTAEEGKAPERPLAIKDASGDLRKLLSDFEIADKEFPWKLTRTRESEKWIEYELTFPSAVKTDVEENNTVFCKYWVPKDDQKSRPAAVVLHWLGGTFAPLEAFSQKIAERGVATLMMWMPHYGKRRSKDPEKRQRMLSLDNDQSIANFRQAVLDVRRSGDWLASRPDVDAGRVGILGVSLGAVVGELASSIDPSFKRLCFLVGGGDLPGIVFNGSKEMSEAKKKAEELGLTKEKLAEMWRPIEPLTYASRLDRSSVLMINAEDDQVIPRSSTEKLWEAIGKPEIVWYKADHVTWIAYLPKILEKVAVHLKKEAWALPAVPTIRVLLKENAEEVALDMSGECDVRRPQDPKPLATGVAIGRAVAKAEVTPKPTAPAKADDGIRVGDRTWNERWIVLEPKGRFKVGDREYEGVLHLIVSRAGGLHAVNELDFERYVAGVIGPEIGSDAPPEALKAQAVCARTFAFVQLRESARSATRQVFDVYDDVRDQVYGGAPARGSAVEQAAEATAGRILTFQGKPFKAFFSSTCGGSTESGAEVFGADIAPLAGVECGSCGQAKYFSWTLRLKAEDVAAALKDLAGGGVKDLAVAASTKGGRVARMKVTRSDGVEALVAGPDFRRAIGYDRLRSTMFAVGREGEEFVFRGSGWGHAVGMCQEGAIGMARAGGGWEAILSKYYPSAEIKPAY